eukprot:360020-Chlamydomonas_euryale.AAC.1
MRCCGTRNTTGGSRSASPARTVRTVRDVMCIRTYSMPETPCTHVPRNHAYTHAPARERSLACDLRMLRAVMHAACSCKLRDGTQACAGMSLCKGGGKRGSWLRAYRPERLVA